MALLCCVLCYLPISCFHKFSLGHKLQHHLQAGSAVMPTEGVYVHSVIRRVYALNQCFPWFYAHFHWSCQLVHNNITFFFGNHVRAFYPLPQLSIQTKHQLACCFHYKYFQLEIRKKKLILSYTFLSPLVSVCMLIILRLLGGSTRAQPCTWQHLSGNFQKCGMCLHITDAPVITP